MLQGRQTKRASATQQQRRRSRPKRKLFLPTCRRLRRSRRHFAALVFKPSRAEGGRRRASLGNDAGCSAPPFLFAFATEEHALMLNIMETRENNGEAHFSRRRTDFEPPLYSANAYG